MITDYRIRRGTGDGYYFLLDTLPPQVALQSALNLREALVEFNPRQRLPAGSIVLPPLDTPGVILDTP